MKPEDAAPIDATTSSDSTSSSPLRHDFPSHTRSESRIEQTSRNGVLSSPIRPPFHPGFYPSPDMYFNPQFYEPIQPGFPPAVHHRGNYRPTDYDSLRHTLQMVQAENAQLQAQSTDAANIIETTNISLQQNNTKLEEANSEIASLNQKLSKKNNLVIILTTELEALRQQNKELIKLISN